MDNEAGVLNIDDNNVDAAKAGISHRTISGGLLHGLYLSDNINLTAFDNNKIENVDAEPVYFFEATCTFGKIRFDFRFYQQRKTIYFCARGNAS
jgi:hypothetical protein